MARPRILIANDDGFHAQGIGALADAMQAIGDVWVVAPDRERSATSHAISLHKPLRLRRIAAQRYCVDGTPTDSVYMGLHHVLPGPADIVLSGINHGANLGNDVIYSGTVSAAMEAALFGYKAIAFSLCLQPSAPGVAAPPAHFESAAAVAVDLVEAALLRPMPLGVLLNVNLPDLPRQAVAGVKLCRLGYTAWNDCVAKRVDPRGRDYYWIGGDRQQADDTADADHVAIASGHVAVTPIHYDVTDFRSFAYVRSLPLKNLQAVDDSLGDLPPQRRTAAQGS